MYRVMYHDPGYHPATLYEERDEDWCRKWPGRLHDGPGRREAYPGAQKAQAEGRRLIGYPLKHLGDIGHILSFSNVMAGPPPTARQNEFFLEISLSCTIILFLVNMCINKDGRPGIKSFP